MARRWPPRGAQERPAPTGRAPRHATAARNVAALAARDRLLARALSHHSSVLIYGAAALAEVGQATADASVAGINHFDVAANHGDTEELDLVTRPGGSLEAVVRAKQEGLAGAIGITGHGQQAPATHLEALGRFPFDTVLIPLNFVLGQDPAYLADYQALVAEIQARA